MLIINNTGTLRESIHTFIEPDLLEERNSAATTSAMETNGASNSANAATPRTTPTTQSSIRSFFQPRAPAYTAPPPASTPSPSLPQYQKPPPASSRQTPNTQAPKATTDTPSTLPPRASISPVQEQHIQPLRRINSLLLPIAYPDNFYHKILTPDNFSRVLLWTETEAPPASSTFSSSTTRTPTVVGGIVCRVDASPSDPKTSDIYVQSLALLSPYRGQGLATSLLNTVITSAISQQSDTKIESLYAHVWTENTEALEWYAARGFKREEPILHGYYRRLKPDTAWLIRRRLSPTDHLQNQSRFSPVQTRSSSPAQTGTPPIPRSTASSPPNRTDSPLSPTRPSLSHTASFQDRRPDREWNDLPSDLGLLQVPSAASSRSSSTSRDAGGKKKKERKYPPAAFGA